MSLKSTIDRDIQNLPFVKDFSLIHLNQLIIFIIALTVGGVALYFLALYCLHFTRVFFDKIGKNPYLLQISFDKYLDYNDTKYLQVMDNLFKKLDQSIKGNDQALSIEVHKKQGKICFILSSSSPKILAQTRTHLELLDGVKIQELEALDDPLTSITKHKLANKPHTKKLYFKSDNQPIHFKTQNIFGDIVQILEKSEADGGCLLLFRSSKAKYRLLGKKRHWDELSKDPKRRDGYINQEKSKLIEEKLQHGELLNTSTYVYSSNNNQVNSLISCFAQSNLSNDIRSKRASFTSLPARYIAPEFNLLRPLNGYSYLNTHELAHIFRPVFSSLQVDFMHNLVTIPANESSDLLILNTKGDVISTNDAYNGIFAFGDKGSGKSSAFIGNITASLFQKNFGLLFTVYKAEEVYPILKLAQNAGRMDDVILLNKGGKWRTNIINQELEATGSIANAISLFDDINKTITQNKSAAATDPYWENTAKVLFANLLRVTIIFYGSFSLSLFNHLSDLASEYARFMTNQNEGKMSEGQKNIKGNQEKKKIEFENILETIKSLATKKTASIKANTEEIDAILTYFTVDWVNLPEKTRESVYSVFRSNIDNLTQSAIAKLLLCDIGTGDEGFFDIQSTRNGKIIILDEPVSTRGEEGRNFQEVFKSFWYTAMKRYPEGQACALISDEFQEFGASSDAKFLSVSRSYRVAMIMATQNKASLVAKLGNIETDKILANTQVKIFFQSSDEQTWEFARKIMGVIDTNSYTEQYNTTLTTSTSSNQKFELLGQHFQQLGMYIDPSQAEAFAYNRGYTFKSGGKKYLQVVFNKVDQALQSEVMELIPQDKPTSNETQKNHGPKFVIQQILERESRANPEPERVKIETPVTAHHIEKEEKKVEKPEVFISINDIISRFPVGRSTFYKLVDQGIFKSKTGISKGGKAPKLYMESEIIDYFNRPKLENTLDIHTI